MLVSNLNDQKLHKMLHWEISIHQPLERSPAILSWPRSCHCPCFQKACLEIFSLDLSHLNKKSDYLQYNKILDEVSNTKHKSNMDLVMDVKEHQFCLPVAPHGNTENLI